MNTAQPTAPELSSAVRARCRAIAENVSLTSDPATSNTRDVEQWITAIVRAGWTLGAMHDRKIGFLRHSDYKLVEVSAVYDGVRYFHDEVMRKEGRAA
jgi:hypothetical protein